MKLLKGWKLRVLTGLALASMGGQLQAQYKPGGMTPSLLGKPGPVAPASYSMPGPAPGMMQEVPPMAAPMGMDPGVALAGYDACADMGGCGPECNGNCGPGCGVRGGCGPGILGHSMLGGCGPGMGACGPGMGGGFGGACGPGCNGNCGPEGCGLGLGRGGLLGSAGCTDMFGRDRCGLLTGLLGKLGSCRGSLRPYGEGGIATQRWFDVYGEAMFLKRTKGAANFITSKRGINGVTVLGTDQVDFDDIEAGLSLQANIQTGPGSNLEFVYFGLNAWDASATALSNTTTGDLFSFISNFGQLPLNGFDDTDRSLSHRLAYSSELHNGEINFRRRWAEPHGFFQGSFLAGVRYLDLDERILFEARGTVNNTGNANTLRFADYTVDTNNSLAGFQIGADFWYNLYPGIKIGTEGKTGIYNNRAHQRTNIVANSVPTYREQVVDNNDAYITQVSSQLYYRLNYSWAFRTSYQVMYIDGVALAAENFNSIPPTTFVSNSTRTPRIETDAEIVLQGFTIGAEYTW
jgi:hypothetical protein